MVPKAPGQFHLVELTLRLPTALHDRGMVELTWMPVVRGILAKKIQWTSEIGRFRPTHWRLGRTRAVPENRERQFARLFNSK
jgi:hypothetical protein